MEWVTSHTDMLGLIVNAAMLVVWVVYLSIFLFSYLRQRRPCILITQGAGAGLSAKCFISNLGLEPIYVLDVLLTLKTEDQQHLVNVTERSQLTDREQANPKEATNQGRSAPETMKASARSACCSSGPSRARRKTSRLIG